MSACSQAPPLDGRPARARPGLGGVVARVGVALFAFALVIVLAQRTAAPGGGGLVGAKLAHYRAHADEYDTVVLGSSHVYRAFVPAEFDRALAESGLAARSFNFGVQLPSLLECRFLLREVLAAGSGKLRRVFLEYQPYTPQIDPANAFHPRSVYWHDRELTAQAVERAFHWDAVQSGLAVAEAPGTEHSLVTVLERELPAAWRVAGEHEQHWLARVSMVGRGRDVAKGLLGRAHGQAERLAPGDGWLSLEAEERALARAGHADNAFARRREAFARRARDYALSVAALESRPVVFGDEEWMNPDLARVDDLDVVATLVADARAAGVELVLVVMPSQSCNRPVEARLEERLGVTVLRFNRPSEFPALYDPALRFDAGHLSADGARVFTRLLAQRWAQREVER